MQQKGALFVATARKENKYWQGKILKDKIKYQKKARKDL